MPDVVGIRFKQCGKIYNFEANGINAKPGMRVVVDSEMGLSLGIVVKAEHKIERSKQQLKKVLRTATVQDLETDRNNRSLEDEASAFCRKKVKSHNLFMKVVGTEVTLDRKRLIFYFTADGRIDFRELVRDLASKFKTRIEMRQIGVRDEVKRIGGIGCCGKEVCCKVFLTSFEPISIRMAKKQELVLNPGKLSGICGRLMCCLGYEIEQPAREPVKDAVVSVESKDETLILEEGSAEETMGEAESSVEKYQAETASSLRDIPQPPDEVKTFQEKAQPPQTLRGPEKTKPAKAQEKTDMLKRKDRGKPFNKRKKFWKKKKR